MKTKGGQNPSEISSGENEKDGGDSGQRTSLYAVLLRIQERRIPYPLLFVK
jgi:hypothetical protein